MDTSTPVVAQPQPTENNPKNRQTIALDLRLVVALLLVIIAGMLLIWKPWDSSTSSASANRTIKVTGEASLKAEPDEFVFFPSYTVQNASRDTALAELTRKSDEIIAKLKSLGVADGQIKSSADSYDRGITYPYPDKPGGEQVPSYTQQLTITVTKRDMAQKVQDYLATTAPTGTISPSTNFSTAKRKGLENKARDEATKDARAKADQSAKNLGFKVGNVKSVSDGSGFGGVVPFGCDGGLCSGAAEIAIDSAAPSKLNVQPGQNDLSYTVTVEYFVR